MKYTLFTDGGYSIEDNIGAYAFVILVDGEVIKEGAESITNETNNRAEIKAILYGVKAIEPGSEITIFSDSQYAIGVLSGKYNAKANLDLIDEFKTLVKKDKYKLTFRWVQGHSGNEYNERCDQLCNEAAGRDLNKHRSEGARICQKISQCQKKIRNTQDYEQLDAILELSYVLMEAIRYIDKN